MGILYRYHPDSGRRLAEGFPRFAKTLDGRLVLARSPDGLIVGYALIAKPDPRERWGDPDAPEIWELGMIEVARGWRRRGISRRLLRACFADGRFDDRIVLATAYSWHWDLEATKLAKYEYRQVLVKLFGFEGFKPLETNEPNIQEDPANQLLVRIGPLVSPEVRGQFLTLLQADQQPASMPRDGRSSPERAFAELLARYLQVWNPAWWYSPANASHRATPR
jgi:acetoin utilization protein AcuA